MTAARLPVDLLSRPRPQARAAVSLYSSAEHALPEGPAIPEPEGVKVHPAARLLPMMGPEDFARLRKNIRDHGYDPRKPLVYVGDALADGRNRAAAALAEGLRLEDLPTVQLPDGESPVLFVLRENLDRRQLTRGQRAAIAAEAEPLLAEEAKKRMAEGARRARQGGDESTPPSPRNERGRAAVQAAERTGAGVGATKAMIGVQRRAPEIVELVKDRAVNVAEAVRLSKVDPAARAEKIAQILGGADPAEVAPPTPKHEPNLGRMVSLLFVRCGQGPKLASWRDLLAKVVSALGQKEDHIQHSGKRLPLDNAVDLLGERLPRPGGS